jgi:hypothetical protein
LTWKLPALHLQATPITLAAARQGGLAVVRADVQKLLARPVQWLEVEYWTLAE